MNATLPSSIAETTPSFVCSNCGHCCNHWQVQVHQSVAVAWQHKPWVQQRLAQWQLALEPLYTSQLTDQGLWGYILPLKPNRTCVFWEDGTGCLLHTHEGPEAKPLDCRRFPFAAVRGAEEAPLQVDASAACSTVARHFLSQGLTPTPAGLEAQALSESLAEPNRVSVAYPGTPQRLPTHVPRHSQGSGWLQWLLWLWLKPSLPVPWGVHQQRLQALAPCFLSEDSVGEAAEALTVWGALRLAFAVLATAVDDDPLEAAAWAQRWAGAALNQGAPHPAWVLWVQAKFLRQPHGCFGLLHWLCHRTLLDAPLLGPQPVKYATLRRYTVLGPVFERTQKAFAWHLLRRQVPLAYGAGWLNLWLQAAVALCLLEVYARWATVEEQQIDVEGPSFPSAPVAVSDSAAQLAVRIVERYYSAHQPRFASQLEGHPFWGALCLVFWL